MKTVNAGAVMADIAALRLDGKTTTGINLDDLEGLIDEVVLGRQATHAAAEVLDYCRVALTSALGFISKPKNRLPIQTAIAKIDELLEVPEEEAIDDEEAARRRARSMLVLPPEYQA